MRLNNRLRRIVEAALGGLTLMAPDPGKRLEAAQAVFKSKDANALPALDQAIAKETDARVKQALIEARAAVVLYLDNASDADKIDAIARDPPARRSGRARAARRIAGERLAGGEEGRGRRHRLDPEQSRDLDRACKTPGTGSRSARCCCSPRSGSPSPSA